MPSTGVRVNLVCDDLLSVSFELTILSCFTEKSVNTSIHHELVKYSACQCVRVFFFEACHR